ncbi:MAG: tonB-system energizer ExbB [Bradyrhizobium sp.]
MKTMHLRRAAGGLLALTLLIAGLPASAQQSVGTPPQTQPALPLFPPAAVQPAAPQAQVTPSSAQSPLVQPAAPRSTQGAAVGQPRPQSVARAITPAGRVERDMSPWTMFLSADILVKAVMVSLAFASLMTWTIFLAKTLQLGLAKRRLRKALKRISKTRTLSEAQLALGPSSSILGSFLGASIQELRLSADTPVEGGVKDRVASSMAELTRVEARSVRMGLAVLATIGSTSPFVGLFGTVWGIMNSFIGISKAQTTNLAVVAPGIAEALLATAIGLVAAIPAVMIYNHFSRVTKGYVDLVGRASGEVGRLLSRDLDRSQGRLLSRAAE